ncbi:hypothetical protein MHYP_G00066160 [Metynnis hypsauchen]
MTHPGLHENSLTKILEDVVEEVRLSIDKDINGADLLHSLLSAPWLNSLLRVYECLLEYTRTSPRPCLLYASTLSQEIMRDMRSLTAPSPEAQELYMLLRARHFQALLSAHDSVAQKDYSPVLPPLPDDLPEDEEAMRIVCLVKNKQPLATGGLSASSGLLHTPHTVQPHSLLSYPSTSNCSLLNSQLPGGGPNQSAPAICSSVLVEKGINENHLPKWTCTQTPHSTSTRSSQSPCMGFSSGICSYPHTALSSPLLRTHRTLQTPCSSRHTLELTKQRSLDELKTAMHNMASSMECSSGDVCYLSHRMVAVTERMKDSAEENAQALNLLVEVVDKLQGLIIANKSLELSCASRPPDVPELSTATKIRAVLSRPRNEAKEPSVPCSVFESYAVLSSASSSSSSSTCSSSVSSYMEEFLTSQEPSCTQRGSSINAIPFRSDKGQSFHFNDSAVSRLNDGYGTIGCLSSGKRKSKMKK